LQARIQPTTAPGENGEEINKEKKMTNSWKSFDNLSAWLKQPLEMMWSHDETAT
jgi:hypothetical protein